MASPESFDGRVDRLLASPAHAGKLTLVGLLVLGASITVGGSALTGG